MTSARERSKERVPTRLGTWLSAVALGVAWVLAGCYAPPSVTQRVSDAARDLNLAARFGDLEGAAALAAPAVRAEFLARRALWGGEIRILDVELQGLRVDEAAARAALEDVDRVQALSYLKASGYQLGLLVNFGGPKIEIVRLANTRGPIRTAETRE